MGQAGNLIRSIATGTFSTVGWILFILIVSYFTLADAGQFPDMLSGLVGNINVPGYEEDIRRLGKGLNRIWNAFMRGQLILFLMTVAVVYLLLTVLGVRNAMALALVAGGARFVPYVGPAVTWISTWLVTFFQTSNYLGLEPITYSLIVLGLVFLFDQIIDNLVTPRLYGQALGVHPAAVLVAAIIAANLLGLIGLLLAAPVLATMTLFGRYATRKLFDLDPWPEPETDPAVDGENRTLITAARTRIQSIFTRKAERIEDEQPDPNPSDGDAG
jgi:predicted PurR-regulated permease PerM